VLSNSRDVFINCPFDKLYEPLFRVLVFTVIVCGFRVRSALELDDGSTTRIDKLYSIVEECRYSIHDISRTQLDKASKLPRFNMPLELGIFLGAKRYGGSVHKSKRALILDIEKYRYQKFISDLAGMDIHDHGDSPEKAIREAQNWLENVSKRKLPSAKICVSTYKAFSKDLPGLCAANDLDIEDITYSAYQSLIVAWLKPK
jgi:NAD-dependent DNA ligase